MSIDPPDYDELMSAIQWAAWPPPESDRALSSHFDEAPRMYPRLQHLAKILPGLLSPKREPVSTDPMIDITAQNLNTRIAMLSSKVGDEVRDGADIFDSLAHHLRPVFERLADRGTPGTTPRALDIVMTAQDALQRGEPGATAPAGDPAGQDVENRCAEITLKAQLRERGDAISMDAVHAIQRLRMMRDYYQAALETNRAARLACRASSSLGEPGPPYDIVGLEAEEGFHIPHADRVALGKSASSIGEPTDTERLDWLEEKSYDGMVTVQLRPGVPTRIKIRRASIDRARRIDREWSARSHLRAPEGNTHG